ncbi:MAG: class I SAM-dependent methyltransferase [Blastocatellia bacterium]|nr:class I SAM-dependent methyltransferase [Blastocatellia bacterium]
MISLDSLFAAPIEIEQNIVLQNDSRNDALNQTQTKDIFSDKWKQVEQMDSLERLYESQFEWFLQLYGFGDEQDLQEYLSDKSVILDAGCGLGYKAAWFARLAPQATVIGIDISDAAYQAAANFRELPNLVYLKGDIANTGIKPNSVDLVVCDQVIMHTENPEETFRHLSDITKPGGEFACYVYAKKALPRELIDDYFRHETHDVTSEQMWEMSEQLTELGKRLSELNVSFEAPDIPLLGIKGGTYDIQRFIYWNFLKCFWKEDWGFEMSKATNYDWYAPSNAKRYNREEFEQMIRENNLQISYFHQEEACYSGRFAK